MVRRLLLRIFGPALFWLILVFSSSVRSNQLLVPRPEHPRPDLQRGTWQTLNGKWEFAFDDNNVGIAERWFAPSKTLSRRILVPFCFESRLSGIGDPSFHEVVWYRRTISIPERWRSQRIILHFGAVDYEATVWINGYQVGMHQGGHVGFQFDITDYLKPAQNTIVLRAWDPPTDRTIPRGKQYWKPKSEGIWYTRTTGIWQPVWLEAVNAVHVTRLRIIPDVDHAQVQVKVFLSRTLPGLKIRMTVLPESGNPVLADEMTTDRRMAVVIPLVHQQLWSPEHPHLYHLNIEVSSGGKVLDQVSSYFGQRSISTKDGRVFLNGVPYYLRMVLDQGYWPESILTPPGEEAIQYDIRMTKAFGFTGVRKHQKAEDPRWLYWADKMGLMVWGEMANAQEYSEDYVERFVREWMEIIDRDFNHPSIVVWVPINESWGVPDILTNKREQEHARTMVHLIRSLDPTRLVVDNDGWEHTDATELFTLHDYARTGEELAAKYKPLESDRTHIPDNARAPLAKGFSWNQTPFLMTEFGGIAYRVGNPPAPKEWGYSGIEPSQAALLLRLEGLVRALRDNSAFAGYCYTQLTDVEQEINGLMTFDRKPKADPSEFARIFGH
ncbi:MAG: glycoside hydrolase family 2 TIM barrel-domain containing protein [Terriglobia bacterium]